MSTADEMEEKVRLAMPDAATREVADRLLTHLRTTPAQLLRMLTLGWLTNTYRSLDGEAIVKVAREMVSCGVLVEAAFLGDSLGVEEISSEDLSEARREGGLVHPATGELITDFERLLLTFFYISPNYEAARDAARTPSA